MSHLQRNKWNLAVLRLQLSSCAALWNAAWTQPVGADRRGTEQTRSGAVPECTRIQWNPGVIPPDACVMQEDVMQNGSGADIFQFYSVSMLPAAVLCFYSVATPVIKRLTQQIRKASIFAGWRSTMQQSSTEQIEWDRKLDSDTTLKHLVNFRIKYSALMPDHISLNFINKLSLCAGAGQKSTD